MRQNRRKGFILRLLLLLLTLMSINAQAFDFKKMIDSANDKIGKILGKTEEKTESMELPNIPVVNQDATNTSVYDKNGTLNTQGDSFHNLPAEEKTKFRLAYLEELYRSTLRVKGTERELVTLLNVLEQGGTREGAYRSIVLGSEYLSKESSKTLISKGSVDFTIYYTEKYLALRYNSTEVAKLNIWMLKRVLTEKSLEVLDAFPKDGKDLYTWYAILSSDLAKNYNNAFDSETRKNASESFHFEWAKRVPLQHIKSELIIKLHKVFNFLN